jgi:hypothetical protein
MRRTRWDCFCFMIRGQNRKGVRRGRVIDRSYIEWMHRWPCLVAMKGFDGCAGVRTVHHVRRFGEQKNDWRTVTLCEAHHMHGCGPDAVHAIGKAGFRAKFGIELEVEILAYNYQWIAEGNTLGE